LQLAEHRRTVPPRHARRALVEAAPVAVERARRRRELRVHKLGAALAAEGEHVLEGLGRLALVRRLRPEDTCTLLRTT